MGKLLEKTYPEEQLREKVTIRVLPEKKQVYPRFKELVTEILHSDVCFVTTSLWEAFVRAMDENPPTDLDQLEIQFLRQNVQINIGCQILYQPKKGRRYPQQPPPWEFKDKNHFLPLLFEQWDSMSEKAKEFWRQRLIERGIMPPPQFPVEQSRATTKKISKTLEQSMTIVSRLFLGSKFHLGRLLRSAANFIRKLFRRKRKRNPFVV